MTAVYDYSEISAAYPGAVVAPKTSTTAAPHNDSARKLGAGRRADRFGTLPVIDLIARARAGLNGWDGMDPASRRRFIEALLDHPAIRKIAAGPRGPWRDFTFALVDAECQGVPDVRNLARDWSASCPEKFNEADFGKVWDSYDPRRPGAVTARTLVAKAREVGLDPTHWLDTAKGSAPGVNVTPVANRSSAGNAPAPFFHPIHFDAPYLHPVPWVVDGVAIAGELAGIVGAGGMAKTVLTTDLLVNVAAGRPSWGGRAIKPRPDGRLHRVAIVSGEEDGERIGLLVAAAVQANNLSASEHAAVAQNLMIHDARRSGLRIGTPRPNMRESISPDDADQACADLEAALLAEDISLAVMDTLSVLIAADEIDNTTMTVLLRRLGRAARTAKCAIILLHHVPKQTREAAAAQRGEVTLVRGGGSIVNVLRVVLTVTGLPPDEAGASILNGQNPDAIRRLDCAKMNDAPMPDPLFLETVGEPVTLFDGSTEWVRAIRFLTPPQSTAGSVSTPILNIVVRAIDAGATVHGVSGVPLSRAPQAKDRNALAYIADALRASTPTMTAPHAAATAKAALKHLMDTGCVVETTVQVPKKPKPNGRLSGTEPKPGLVVQHHLIPWVQPAAPAAAVTPAATPSAPVPGKGIT